MPRTPSITAPGPKNIGAAAALGVIGFLFVFILASSSVFMIDQKEQGVILRFGKYVRLVEPGLHMKLPFWIERRVKVPTQVVLKEEFGFRSLRPGITTVYSAQDFPDESIMLTG